MIYSIDSVLRPLLHELSLLNPPLPLVHCLRHYVKVRLLEEQAHNGSVHVAFLLCSFLFKILIDLLLCIPLFQQEIPQSFDITSHFIALQYDITFSLNILST